MASTKVLYLRSNEIPNKFVLLVHSRVAGAISQIFDLINHVDVNLEDHDYSLALA